MKTASRRCGVATTPSTQLEVRKRSEKTLSQRQFGHLLLLFGLRINSFIFVLGLLDLLAELLDLLRLVLVFEAEGLVDDDALLAFFLHRF